MQSDKVLVHLQHKRLCVQNFVKLWTFAEVGQDLRQVEQLCPNYLALVWLHGASDRLIALRGPRPCTNVRLFVLVGHGPCMFNESGQHRLRPP